MSSWLQLLSLLCSSFVLWKIIRRLFFPTVLENIPGPPAASWLFGSLNELNNPKAWDIHREISETYGAIVRTKGAFGSNALYVFDPKALHHIIVKDQLIYEETDRFIEANRLMFGNGIFTKLGAEHRRHRKMLNPVFSTAHMRQLLPMFYEITHKVEQVFISKVQNGSQEIDIVNWITRLALELIGQTGLGYTFDNLTENDNQHPYGIASKQLYPIQNHADEFAGTIIMPKLARIGSPAFRRFMVDLAPIPTVKELRGIIDVLYETSVEIFMSKKKAMADGDGALASQLGKGKDIISILMKANMVADESDRLSDEEVIAQIGSLTFAATDTTSGAISRSLHLLSLHKDVQRKLREEIRNARKANGGNDIGHDELVSLPYLDAVCRETLRLHPPAPITSRTARQDIILPLSKPVRGINGDEICDIPVPKGTNITISVLSFNRNPDLWGPGAYEWKPERWLDPLPDPLMEARVPGIYSHLMTFLAGPRSCIGFKFAELEMKVVLSLLIEHLEFSPGSKEIVWQMTAIVSPHTDVDSTNPSMPLRISLATTQRWAPRGDQTRISNPERISSKLLLSYLDLYALDH